MLSGSFSSRAYRSRELAVLPILLAPNGVERHELRSHIEEKEEAHEREDLGPQVSGRNSGQIAMVGQIT